MKKVVCTAQAVVTQNADKTSIEQYLNTIYNSEAGPDTRYSLIQKNIMQVTEYIIGLNDIHLYAHHGVMPQERVIGAWFTIDLELTMDKSLEIDSDDLEKTISYADVYETVCNEMNKPSKLIEHVCSRISESLYQRFTQIKGIKITLTKDTPPMGGDRVKASATLKSAR